MKIIIHEHQHQSSSSSSSESSTEQMAEMMEMMTEMQETIQELKRKIHKQNKKIKTMTNVAAKPINTHIRYEYLDDICADSTSDVFGENYESTDDDSVQSGIVATERGEAIADFVGYCSKSDADNSVEEVEVEVDVVVEKVIESVKDDVIASIQVKIEEGQKKSSKACDAFIKAHSTVNQCDKAKDESIQAVESKVEPVKTVEAIKVDEPVEEEEAVKVEKAEELHQEEELEQIEIDGKDYYVDGDNVIYEASDPENRVGVLDENDEPIFDKVADVKISEAIKEEVVEDIIKELVKEEVAETEEIIEEEEELEEIEIDGQDYYIDGDNVIYGMNEQRDPGDRVGVLDENDDAIFDATNP